MVTAILTGSDIQYGELASFYFFYFLQAPGNFGYELRAVIQSLYEFQYIGIGIRKYTYLI